MLPKTATCRTATHHTFDMLLRHVARVDGALNAQRLNPPPPAASGKAERCCHLANSAANFCKWIKVKLQSAEAL